MVFVADDAAACSAFESVAFEDVCITSAIAMHRR